VRSLTKAGWTILSQQEYLSIGTSPETHRRLYIDIKARLNQELIVLIEVKSLDRSPVHQLMELLGQYLVYRAALDYLAINTPLYVAVPQVAYQYIIQHVLGQEIMNQYAIPLVIYDPVQEEIREWIPPL
jgi:hypothetical protein